MGPLKVSEMNQEEILGNVCELISVRSDHHVAMILPSELSLFESSVRIVKIDNS